MNITGYIYEAGKPHIDKYMIGGGACGEEIAKQFPQFAIFDKLHLSDVNGAPMYAIENGFYHLTVTGVKVAADYLRISENEAQKLKDTCKDKAVFGYTLLKMGLIDKWKNEANEAIKILEELTGKKFIDNSTKLQPMLTAEKIQEIEQKINGGFYSPENVDKRQNEEIEFKKSMLRAEIEAEYKKAKKKAKNDYSIQLFVLECGIGLNNYIYYNHTNTVSFNWKGYEVPITNEEFNKVLEYAKTYTGQLPKSVKFELSKNK